MTLSPRGWAFVATLWLALATIFSHALDLSGSPVRESSGSAFNPFTSDVSLVPERAAVPAKDGRDQGLSNNEGYPADGGQPNASLAFGTFILPLAPQPAGVRSLAAPSSGPTRLRSRGFQARAPPPA